MNRGEKRAGVLLRQSVPCLISLILIACTPTQPTLAPRAAPATTAAESTPTPLPPSDTPEPTQTSLPETATAQAANRGCALLAREEVESVIGPLKFDPIPTYSLGGNGTYYNCRYDSDTVYLFVSHGPFDGITAREYFDIVLAGMPNHELIILSGKEAFWGPRNKLPGELVDGTLLVLHNELVYMFGVGSENARDVAVQIATLALSHLP